MRRIAKKFKNISKKALESRKKEGTIVHKDGSYNAATRFKKGHRGFAGERNGLWKGDSACYQTIHQWVNRIFGKPTYCSKDPAHASKQFVWANRSGHYTRQTSDWWSLCQSCNMKDKVKIHKRFAPWW